MSTSGSELYRKISGLRSNLESEISKRTKKNLELGRRSRDLLNEQAELWNSLAAIHIDLGFDLPREINALMSKRKDRLENHQQTVADGDRRLNELLAEHKAQESAMREAQAAFNEHESLLARSFEADADAVALTVQVNGLHSSVAAKRERAQRVEDECRAKIAAYEGDELFLYLRKRGFGTEAYTATGLFARLDHWVSRLVNFDKAATDYEHLLKVPGWHREDLEEAEQQLQSASSKLAVIQEKAFKTLAPYKDKLRTLGRALDEAADAISRQHAEIASAQRVLSEAALAQDGDLRKIKQELAAALERINIRDLQELARKTDTPEDDEIVKKIVANRNDLAEVEASSTVFAREIATLKGRASEFEGIETRMRRKDWHHSDHRFSDGLDNHLSSMLAGALTADAVWSVMSRAHRDPVPSYRETVSSSPWPSSTGSSWNSSSSSSSPSSSWGSSSSSSGSDYRTGGGSDDSNYATGGGG